MFKAILELLPEWTLPLLVGLALWFGLNFFLLVDVIAERTTLATCPDNDLEFCQCIADVMVNDARLDLTLWTSSLGFYEVQHNKDVLAAKKRGEQICQS